MDNEYVKDVKTVFCREAKNCRKTNCYNCIYSGMDVIESLNEKNFQLNRVRCVFTSSILGENAKKYLDMLVDNDIVAVKCG